MMSQQLDAPAEFSQNNPQLKNDLVSSLKDSVEYFRKLVDLTHFAIMVHRNGILIYLNPGILHLLGYEKAEELTGRPLLTLIPPENHSYIKDRVEKMTQDENFYNVRSEQALVRKNGERILVESESIKVIHDGKPAVISVVYDITSRKKTEEALRQSEENFLTIIQNLPKGVMIIDDKNILFANRTLVKMLGFAAAEEFLGHPMLELIHPDYHDVAFEKSVNDAATGASAPPLKIKLIGEKGKTVYVESSNIAIRFFGKNATLVFMRDITYQNKMEQQAVLNDKLATVGTLAAGVAHEINNPLSYVLGNLVFLKEQFADLKNHLRETGAKDDFCVNLLSEMSDELSDIAEGGEKIREIVKGLKAFVHGSEEEVEKLNLNHVIESAINMTFHVIKQKARIEKELAVDLPILTANSGKLQQVFINLLINASQSIAGNHPADNKISVRTGRNDGHLFVEITDTGKGIPENVLPRIFDPFFTTKAVGEGTGLGLSVCNEILKSYPGTIQVHSKVGKGTTFIVNLPLENGRNAAEIDHPSPKMENGLVLAVDDEPGNLELLSRMLRKEYKVLTAFSGVEALLVLEKEGGKVNAIVTDINMPDMSGIALYKAVAEKFPALAEKIIFVTGGAFNQETVEFFKTLPNPCLEKPFSREKLLKAIAPWVDDSTTVTVW
jgi:PAS domain S-box-containing protein